MDVQVTASEGLEFVLAKLSAAKKPPKTDLKDRPVTESFKPKKVSAEEKRLALQGRKQKDLELWQTWKTGGMRPKDLTPLLKNLQPLLQSHMAKYKGRAEVPTVAVEHQHRKLMVDALKKWDPKGGAALGSWVDTHLQRGSRYVNDNKSFAQSPENVWSKFGAYNMVKSNLTDKLGYVPDDQAIHDYALKTKHKQLKDLSLKDIRRLGREQRKGLIESPELDKDHLMGGNFSSRDEQLILMIHPELTKEERSVHQFVFGKYFDKPTITSTGALAKKLGFSDSKVSKLKTSIFKKMEPYRTGD